MDKNSLETLSKNLTIINELGLHARSAAKIAMIAKNAKSKIWVIKDGEKADAKSLIDILTLACGKGTEITIKIDSQMDTDILHSIAELVEDGFGE